jgi:anti-sigma factor RsiW
MTRHDDNWTQRIQAFVDGELDVAERERVEAELARSEEHAELAAALTEMGDLLRAANACALEEADFGGLWSRLDAELGAQDAAATAPAIDPLRLQAFADGQLSGHEAAEVAEVIAASPQARGELGAMAELGDLLRATSAAAVERADFAGLWRKLDAAVGEEITARGGIQTASAVATPAAPSATATFWERVIAFVGGYRSVLLSGATAVAVVLVMLPLLNGGGSDGQGREALEIRVVHINEVRSDPGYAVTVDAFNDGTAPVIYIRPEGQETPRDDDEDPALRERREDDDGVFRNPI